MVNMLFLLLEKIHYVDKFLWVKTNYNDIFICCIFLTSFSSSKMCKKGKLTTDWGIAASRFYCSSGTCPSPRS